MKYYHVAKDGWDGKDLESLYELEGDDAYDIYAEKWPEAGGLAIEHAHLIHLHDKLEDAQDFACEYGGEILLIDAPSDYKITVDDLEYNHPVCHHSIEAKYIKII